MRIQKRLGMVAIAAVMAVGLAACGGSGSSTSPSQSAGAASGFNAAVTGIVNPSTATGGTLNLESAADCDAWDPQRTYYGFCWVMQRLFTRSLMAFPSSNTSEAVVPDMATAPGTHNATFTQWTYTMKPGIKWQDGSAVTTADIKYGIERLFATDVINGGPNQYYLCTLSKCDASGSPAYKGPYKDKAGLPSIVTPNATTITFNLQYPVGIWDNLMALPASAPVPQAHDTGATYGQKPWSSGPFMVSSYTPKQQISFVRNPNWSQATDTVRHPLANAINIRIFSTEAQADLALLAGDYDFNISSGVDPAAQAKIINSPTLKANADDPAQGFVDYLNVMQTVAPLTNIYCRKAIFYAINKSDLIKAEGGSYGGTVANSMTPPTLVGFDPTANVYPTGADNTGDVAMAKQMLTKCGQPNGFTVNFGYQSGSGKQSNDFVAVQQALSRIGITVKGLQQDPSTYFSTFIGSPANIIKQNIGMAWAGWAPDFPLPYGYWKSIADGTTILPEGNSNYPSLNDPKVNSLISQSLTAPLDQQGQLEQQIDSQVMANAVYIPFNDIKALFYRSPKLTNVYFLKGAGFYYDAVNIGISS